MIYFTRMEIFGPSRVRISIWLTLLKWRTLPIISHHRSLQDDTNSDLHSRRMLYFWQRLAQNYFFFSPKGNLIEFHINIIGGHGGVLKKFIRLSANLYWPNMKNPILCQKMLSLSTTKILYYESSGALAAIIYFESGWKIVSRNFITHLPSSRDFPLF